MQYFELVRSLESYNSVVFPHCTCDARKDGHIRIIVSLSELKLQACDVDGKSQVCDSFTLHINLTPICIGSRALLSMGNG